MKIWLIIPLILILFTSCASQPPPDTPRYTANEVIAVAQAYSPEKGTDRGQELGFPKWSTEYKGKGVWLVHKYNFMGQDEYYQFYEDTGELR